MSERRDVQGEARFLPQTLADAVALRTAVQLLIATGCVPGVSRDRADSYADQLTGWLVGKTRGPDDRAAPTRAKYRRVLAALEARVGAPAIASNESLYRILQPALVELEQLAQLELEQVG